MDTFCSVLLRTLFGRLLDRPLLDRLLLHVNSVMLLVLVLVSMSMTFLFWLLCLVLIAMSLPILREGNLFLLEITLVHAFTEPVAHEQVRNNLHYMVVTVEYNFLGLGVALNHFSCSEWRFPETSPCPSSTDKPSFYWQAQLWLRAQCVLWCQPSPMVLQESGWTMLVVAATMMALMTTE